MSIPVFSTIAELADWRAGLAQAGSSLALVPTMGALHAGHLALVAEASRNASAVVVSIFVNPLQFVPGEDIARYPRDLAGDLAKLAETAADAVFAPVPEEIYPDGPGSTLVRVAGISDVLCGRARPGHFEGVATVVAKLFNLTRPDVAVFGQKDAQQLAVIRRLVKDLNFPVRIVGIPTVREASGLALSSRNRYLSPAEKARAAAIYRALTAARALAQGQPAMPVPPLVDLVQTVLSEQAIDPEYVAVVDPGDFTPLAMVRRDQPALLAVAARVGSARLIDNIALNP